MGLTVTWMVSGRLPEVGFTVSQFPPSLVIAVAVKEVTLDLLLESVTGFVTGTVLFAGKVKLKELGSPKQHWGP